LTVKSEVPPGLNSVTVKQAKIIQHPAICKDNNKNYIYYNAIPNGGDVRIDYQ
jgi:hypothetical protein